MVEIITDEALRSFVHSQVSDEFGLTIEQVAEKTKGYGRFSSWLNGDVARIKEVLNKVKSNGVSPAFFSAYEKTEGYNSSWGWLNHTHVNGSPLTDADSVSKWVVTQSKNMTDNPAWIDYANYKDFVPSAIKTAGNADFKNMTAGSIGRVVIAGTAGATWEVYYPNGLKKEFNGVQNYGAPINGMMNTILEWNGTITGGGGSDPSTPSGTNRPGQGVVVAKAPQYKYEEGQQEMIYTVKSGDTLSGIANKLGANVNGIATLEPIQNKNNISVGQTLYIPLGAKKSTPAPAVKQNVSNPKKYTIKNGDNLSTIAKKNGTTVAQLQAKNGIKNPDKIYVGQVIKL